MIKKTFFCFVILVVLYSVFRVAIRSDIDVSQAPWQSNQVAAQNYLYAENIIAENIIVGTSLSSRLVGDSLQECLNFGFGGESPYQGLALIIKKGIYPKRVFIETNLLSKTEETKFNDLLYDPILMSARKYLPILRDGKQPLPLFENFVESKIMYNIIPSKFSILEETEAEILARPNNNPYLSFTIGGQIDGKVIIDKVTPYIDSLKAHKVSIIFFEMPTDNSCSNETIIGIWNVLQTNFPAQEYTYIPKAGCDEYKASDGIHLGESEALKYTLYLRYQIDSLYLIGK